MTCFEAQEMILRYLNDDLNDKELEEFLKHISQCETCYEELEIYFTLLTGLKQLDDDKIFTLDFKKSCVKKLATSKNYLTTKHRRKVVKKVYLALVIGVLGPLTLSFEASEINNKNIPVYTDVKDSDYDLEYINFSSKKLDDFLEDNNEKIKEFLKEKEGIEDEQNSID
jgi:hypothetical protein